MKEITLEWVTFAENDFLASELLIETKRGNPNELVCFHCQQCIEKYMKALLVEYDITFEKTHVLDRLLKLLLPVLPDLELHRDALNQLSNFAADTRYPGEIPVPRQTAINALELAKELREILRLHLHS